jgi:hypothetical protein
MGIEFVLVLPHPIRATTRLQLHLGQQQRYVSPIYLAANQVTQQMAMSNPGAGMMGPEQDPDKLFLSEAENLEVLDHQWILEGIEERLVAKFAKL